MPRLPLPPLPSFDSSRRSLTNMLRPIEGLVQCRSNDCVSPQLSKQLVVIAEQLGQTGWAAEIYDADWRLAWVSGELQTLLGTHDPDELGLGEHVLQIYARPHWQAATSPEQRLASLRETLPYLAKETPGGLAVLAQYLALDEQSILATITPTPAPLIVTQRIDFHQGDLPPVGIWAQTTRLRDEHGQLLGAARAYGSALPASLLALVARGDEAMLDRQRRLFEPGRRHAAILFVDLENSTQLGRSLSSAMYFRLITAILRAVDDAVVAHHGIIGKHVGDGASAFFPLDEFADNSSAARAAIETTRYIRSAVEQLAAIFNAELDRPVNIAINCGLHWGSTIYMGQIVTGGRLEVTALGDEVNEAARLEAAARNGAVLSSKTLIEQLTNSDAQALTIDPHRLQFQPLGQMSDISGKVERDVATLLITEL